MEDSKIQNKLVVACYTGEVELIVLSIQQGANVDDPDETQLNLPIETAIMCDCSNEPLKILIEHGVNLNRVIIRSPEGSQTGMTPLHFAIDEMCGIMDIDKITYPESFFLSKVRLLIENGANVDAVDKNGFKPSDYLFTKMVYKELYKQGKEEIRRYWSDSLKDTIPAIDRYLEDAMRRVYR